jgi:hypothetical protein
MAAIDTSFIPPWVGNAGVMSDGHEEREESEKRREQEARENREDWIDRDHIEEWEPERVDS